MTEAALQGFIDKWLAREPEMRILASFCPPSRLPVLQCWGALADEILATAFELSDPAVAGAKLGWWSKDLAAGPRAQHPLSRALFALPSAAAVESQQWQRLVAEASAWLGRGADAPGMPPSAAALAPLSEVLAAIESGLWSAPVGPLDWTLQLQLACVARMAQAVAGREPPTTSNAVDPTQWREWATATLERQRAAGNAARAALPAAFRRRIAELRLCRLQRDGDPRQARLPAWRVLLGAWRAARTSAPAHGS